MASLNRVQTHKKSEKGMQGAGWGVGYATGTFKASHISDNAA